MSLFMGIDASTQSMSAVIIDLDNGKIFSESSVNFNELPEYDCTDGVLNTADPLVKHCDPMLWVDALEKLFSRLHQQDGLDFSRIVAISGSGQQHGTVYLTDDFSQTNGWSRDSSLVEQVRPFLSRSSAPIWMDSSTSKECEEITDAAGGIDYVLQTTGSPTVERFSGAQIRKFWKVAPRAYEETGVIHLVSSFMGSVLAGKSIPIDFGDGAGMNLMNLAEQDWDSKMLEAVAPGLADKLPPLTASWTKVGQIDSYFVEKYGFSPSTRLLAWSGDNPNSLIGVGAIQPGVGVVSLGTSHTYFAAMPEPKVDPAGYGHVFGNPAGGFMSLICFKNGALAQEAERKKAGLDWREFDECLESTPIGNNGNMMLPYYVPEITPCVLEAEPVYKGSPEFEKGNDHPARIRAVVEAQALRLRLHSAWIDVQPSELRVTGGAAKSTDVCRILANVFNARVERLDVGNSAGLGAAMRAAQGVGAADWDELNNIFCRLAPGREVEPTKNDVEVYREMLPRYENFAKQLSHE